MRGCWHAKLSPYVKNGNVDSSDLNVTNNSGVWHCPDQGSHGEYVYFNQNKAAGRYSFSYGMNGIVAYTNYYGNHPAPGAYYRWPSQVEMDAPASTVYVGDGGGYNARLAPPHYFDCYNKRYLLKTSAYPSGTYREICWEVPDRHNGGANYVFCDGHAKFLQADIAYPTPATKGAAVSAADAKRAYDSEYKYFAYAADDRATAQAKSQ